EDVRAALDPGDYDAVVDNDLRAEAEGQNDLWSGGPSHPNEREDQPASFFRFDREAGRSRWWWKPEADAREPQLVLSKLLRVSDRIRVGIVRDLERAKRSRVSRHEVIFAEQNPILRSWRWPVPEALVSAAVQAIFCDLFMDAVAVNVNLNLEVFGLVLCGIPLG